MVQHPNKVDYDTRTSHDDPTLLFDRIPYIHSVGHDRLGQIMSVLDLHYSENRLNYIYKQGVKTWKLLL